MEISDRIKQIMVHQGLTASALAEIIGVQRSGMSHIFGGRNKPSLDMLIKITEAFPEITIEWLVFGEESLPLSSAGTKSKEVSDYMCNISPGATESNKTQREQEVLNIQTECTESTNQKVGKSEAIMDQVIIFYSDGTFEDYTRRNRS